MGLHCHLHLPIIPSFIKNPDTASAVSCHMLSNAGATERPRQELPLPRRVGAESDTITLNQELSQHNGLGASDLKDELRAKDLKDGWKSTRPRGPGKVFWARKQGVQRPRGQMK